MQSLVRVGVDGIGKAIIIIISPHHPSGLDHGEIVAIVTYNCNILQCSLSI
jgi:hypothetical protein